jgi:predicted transcriptional regulator of viral defense system
MTNYKILTPFENLPYFTIEGFRQIAGEAIVHDEHARTALHRWAKAGCIIQLKKGLYMHRGFFEQHRREAEFSPLVSAILLPQSYLSLEYMLQAHGVLTEITYPVTAITPKNTRTIINSMGTFVYRHIRSALYLGFQLTEAYGVPIAQASPAKALFDYLYLRPLGSIAQLYDLAEELRLNLDEFSLAEREEFAGYVAASGLPKMKRIYHNLEANVWRP